jgi:TonB family protein
LLLAFANPPAFNQVGNNLIITGNVSDRFSDEPIAGANLIIKGTTIGTITDVQGNYRITVNSSQDVIVVSVTGYRTQELTLDKNTKINVLMEPDIIAIDFSKENSFDVFEEPAVNKSTEPGSGGDFVFVEEMPAYPGGTVALQKFIQNNLKYPDESRQAGIEGTVLVTYTIDVNGGISNPKVIRGIQQDLDAEALRVTRLIKGWKPANHGGHPVPTTVTMPVEFRLR